MEPTKVRPMEDFTLMVGSLPYPQILDSAEIFEGNAGAYQSGAP